MNTPATHKHKRCNKKIKLLDVRSICMATHSTNKSWMDFATNHVVQLTYGCTTKSWMPKHQSWIHTQTMDASLSSPAVPIFMVPMPATGLASRPLVSKHSSFPTSVTKKKPRQSHHPVLSRHNKSNASDLVIKWRSNKQEPPPTPGMLSYHQTFCILIPSSVSGKRWLLLLLLLLLLL